MKNAGPLLNGIILLLTLTGCNRARPGEIRLTLDHWKPLDPGLHTEVQAIGTYILENSSGETIWFMASEPRQPVCRFEVFEDSAWVSGWFPGLQCDTEGSCPLRPLPSGTQFSFQIPARDTVGTWRVRLFVSDSDKGPKRDFWSSPFTFSEDKVIR